MATWLVTGGAGFIGSNFVRAALATTGHAVVVLDALTYAGNLSSLGDLLLDPRLSFTQGDITDEAVVRRVFERHRGLLGVDRRGLTLGLLRDRAPGGLRRFDLLRLRQLGSRTRLGLELGLPHLEHRRRHARGRLDR